MSDFKINEGVLEAYLGEGGDVVIPDTVRECTSVPFMGTPEPFQLTLSESMKCSFNDLLSEEMTVLNIPSGTKFECSNCDPNGTSFFKNLKEINVDPDNPTCASSDGILYGKDMKTLYACPAAHEGTVTIPDTVKKIAAHAFGNCKQLKEIVIPDSVTTIEERAFVSCGSLKKIVLPKKLKKIGKDAFLRCSKLVTAGPKGPTKGKGFSVEFSWSDDIPDNAFSGMNKLKSVVLPDTIKSIGKNVFKGCKSLEEINLPDGIAFDSKTFKDCTKLSL